MGRKVFISILGTSAYAKSVYERECPSFVAAPTRFIQLATLQLLGAEKWEKGIAIIGLTGQAKTQNWEFDGKKDVRYGGEVHNEDYKGLMYELEEKFPNLKRIGQDIKDGKNEAEIMENFSTLFKLLEDGDELYFDLTYGFRYLPMLVLVLGNYAKFVLRDIKIEHISYGNFELKNKNGNCTFIDLLPLRSLQEWANAAGVFQSTGQIDGLLQLSNENLRPMLQESRGQDTDLNALNKAVKSLEKVVDNILLARGKNIVDGKDFLELKNSLGALSKSLIEPLDPIIKRIYGEFESFSTKQDPFNVIEAAKWCFNKKQYQQSITYLEEGINTVLCANDNLNWNEKWNRDRIDDALSVKKHGNETEPQLWKLRDVNQNRIEEAREKVKHLLEMPLIDSKADLFNAVKHSRNDWNHAGFTEKASKAKELKKKLERRLDSISAELRGGSDIKNGDADVLFINITNHKSSGWGESQLKAAGELGRIVDLDFPNIEPDSEWYDIDGLILNYLAKVEDLTGDNPKNAVIHVMGEMTFTYRLVNALKSLGYRCVASTTKRIVEESPDGIKTSKFEFCKFREY